MTSKADQVADALERGALTTEPGLPIRHVRSLMDELGVSIGTVIAGADEATRRGVPIDRRRGPNGGYFRAADSQFIADHWSTNEPCPAGGESALTQARRLRAHIDALIATLEGTSS